MPRTHELTSPKWKTLGRGKTGQKRETKQNKQTNHRSFFTYFDPQVREEGLHSLESLANPVTKNFARARALARKLQPDAPQCPGGVPGDMRHTGIYGRCFVSARVDFRIETGRRDYVRRQAGGGGGQPRTYLAVIHLCRQAGPARRPPGPPPPQRARPGPRPGEEGDMALTASSFA